MDQELTNAFGEIRGAIGNEAQATRGEIRRVHKRIDEEKTERKDEAAAHDKESALRANDLEHAVEAVQGETKRVEQKQDDHTKWHKDQKTSSRGMWVAIGIAILSGILGMMQKCVPDF